MDNYSNTQTAWIKLLCYYQGPSNGWVLPLPLFFETDFSSTENQPEDIGLILSNLRIDYLRIPYEESPHQLALKKTLVYSAYAKSMLFQSVSFGLFPKESRESKEKVAFRLILRKRPDDLEQVVPLEGKRITPLDEEIINYIKKRIRKVAGKHSEKGIADYLFFLLAYLFGINTTALEFVKGFSPQTKACKICEGQRIHLTWKEIQELSLVIDKNSPRNIKANVLAHFPEFFLHKKNSLPKLLPMHVALKFLRFLPISPKDLKPPPLIIPEWIEKSIKQAKEAGIEQNTGKILADIFRKPE